MSDQLDLNEVERRAWASSFQDGLWDIFFGLLFLSSAVSDWLHNSGVPPGTRIPSYVSIIALGGLILMLGKRFVSVPRMGRARFGSVRKARQTRLRALLLVSLLVILALFLAGMAFGNGWLAQPEWWQTGGRFVGSAIVTLTLLAVFSLMAYLMEFKRLYLYGVLSALHEVVGVAVQEVTGSGVGFVLEAALASVVALAIGVVVFVHFVRDYAVLAQGAPQR